MAYNLEPRTIKENLLGLIGKNPHAEPRSASTREECFLSDIAENGGGLPEVTAADNGDVLAVVGGAWAKSPAPSSLPPYTSADKGKVLTVGEGSGTEDKYIISPQTVTLDGNGEPAVLPVGSYDFSEVTDGDTLTLTLNGVATQITAASGYGFDFIYNHESGTDTVQIAYSEEQGCGFNYLRRSGDVALQLAGDYQISISKTVPSVEPKWEAASGGIPQFIPDKQTIQVLDEVNGGTRAFDPSSDELVEFLSGRSATITNPCFNDPPSGLCYIAASGPLGISYAFLAVKSNIPTTDTVSDDPQSNAAFVYSNGGGTNLAFRIENTDVPHALIDPAKIKYCRCLPK